MIHVDLWFVNITAISNYSFGNVFNKKVYKIISLNIYYCYHMIKTMSTVYECTMYLVYEKVIVE